MLEKVSRFLPKLTPWLSLLLLLTFFSTSLPFLGTVMVMMNSYMHCNCDVEMVVHLLVSASLAFLLPLLFSLSAPPLTRITLLYVSSIILSFQSDWFMFRMADVHNLLVCVSTCPLRSLLCLFVEFK